MKRVLARHPQQVVQAVSIGEVSKAVVVVDVQIHVHVAQVVRHHVHLHLHLHGHHVVVVHVGQLVHASVRHRGVCPRQLDWIGLLEWGFYRSAKKTESSLGFVETNVQRKVPVVIGHVGGTGIAVGWEWRW